MALMKTLTVNERKHLKAYAAEGTLAKAGKKVMPYRSDNAAAVSACNMIRKPNVTARLRQIFDSIELTEEDIALLYKGKLSTKKELFFTKDGIVTDKRTVDDNTIQMKALDSIADLRGMRVSKTLGVKVNMNIDSEDIQNMKQEELQYLLSQCNEQIAEMENSS